MDGEAPFIVGDATASQSRCIVVVGIVVVGIVGVGVVVVGIVEATRRRSVVMSRMTKV